jgi:sigma-B regulation protein RsbU (phosphoserine phosphatase)
MDATPINGALHTTDDLHAELVHRRDDLRIAMRGGGNTELRRLLGEVDAALHRMDHDAFGRCELCEGEIEAEVLQSDPLRTICLECLSVSERRVLEADLELAAEFQQRLIPKGEHSVHGWKAFIHTAPAGAVGGDFADLIQRPERGLVHFVVGDVSGKGVAAALFGSHLLALIASSTSGSRSLSEMVATVNRLFTAATPARVFATLVWGAVDASGRGELVNAGHLPAVIVGRRGCRRIASSGVPLGIFAGARYESTRFALGDGEQLVLVTDGITESTDGGDNEYGVEGLWSLVSAGDLELSPEQAVSRYLEDVERHRGGQAQHDDVTVMVLRRDSAETASGVALQRAV